jgi:hypothetical protein
MSALLNDPDARNRLGAAAVAVRERYAQERIMAMWERILLAETTP